jgi:hypothetical protein
MKPPQAHRRHEQLQHMPDLKHVDSASKALVRRSDPNPFREKYRVIAVEAERLIIKGIVTGTVLTITKCDPDIPLTSEEYPLGRLVLLTDPCASAPN